MLYRIVEGSEKFLRLVSNNIPWWDIAAEWRISENICPTGNIIRPQGHPLWQRKNEVNVAYMF